MNALARRVVQSSLRQEEIMANTCISNNVPERSSRDRNAIEAAVSQGLRNKSGCRFSIFEDPNHLDITVEIKCPEGCWNRKFSPKNSVQELDPDFIRRAVEKAIFTEQE
jgi:hypothetical protein